MRNRYHFILMLAAALVACVGDTGLTGDIQVQIDDSAGVRIVEYVGVPEVEPPFAIAAEPMYRHGANPGDYAFRGINAGRLFPDGSELSRLQAIVRLRCPRCLDGAVFESLWRMHPLCPSCQLKYEREQGYFVGAMYFSYGMALALYAPLFVVLVALGGFSANQCVERLNAGVVDNVIAFLEGRAQNVAN